MNKIILAQTHISKEQLKKLKEKTGETSNKEALAKAVYHYLECEYIEEEKPGLPFYSKEQGVYN